MAGWLEGRIDGSQCALRGSHFQNLRLLYKLDHDWYFFYHSLINGACFAISQLLQEEEFHRHVLADHKRLSAHANTECPKVGVE